MQYPNPSQTQQQQPIHNLRCKSCQMYPIYGYMYQSNTTSGVNLCQPCFINNKQKLGVENDGFSEYYYPGVINRRINPMIAYVHQKHSCLRCKQSPIVGRRFHCTTRMNTSLCENCFNVRQTVGMNQDGFKVYVDEKTVEAEIEPNFPHYKACDNCSVYPIHGIRWKSTTLKDYSLCPKCYKFNRKEIGMQDHVFKPIYKADTSKAHSGVKCNNCTLKPITGRRFKCVTKRKYNLCEPCFGIRKQIGMTGQNWEIYTLPKVLEGTIKEKMDILLHKGIKCNYCKQAPIMGIRFKNLTKRNKDLCNKCFPLRAQIGYGQNDWEIYKEPSNTKGYKPETLYEKPPNHLVKCNSCKQQIIGRRFKCDTIKNYDLCQNCFNNRAMFGMAYQDWTIYVRPKVVENQIKERRTDVPIFDGTCCGGCKSMPIQGKLFKCLTKPKIGGVKELCEKCFANRANFKLFGNHNWRVFSKPGFVEREIIERIPQHKGIKCDACSVSPIAGRRYKCTTKQNYDLCEKCFQKRNQFNMYFNQAYQVIEEPGKNGSLIPVPPPVQQQQFSPPGPQGQMNFPPVPPNQMNFPGQYGQNPGFYGK